MAQGDYTQFNYFAQSYGSNILNTHTFKIALTTLQVGGTPTIAATDAVPTWGSGGTTDLSTSEVTAGGNYSAGGQTITTGTSLTTNVFRLTGTAVTWTKAAGSPTDIKTAVIYSDTATNKDAVGFVDLTTDGTTAVSLVSQDIVVTINADGIVKVTVNAT